MEAEIPALTKEEALNFFSDVFFGRHHVPRLKESGTGWKILYSGNLATYDSDILTRLVYLAHKYLYRVEISQCNFRYLNIRVHRRMLNASDNLAPCFSRHRTIDEMIEDMNRIYGRGKAMSKKLNQVKDNDELVKIKEER